VTAHLGLAGELGDELVAPGEEDERGGHRGRVSERKTLMLVQLLRIRAAPSNRRRRTRRSSYAAALAGTVRIS
jgi:hypothetical protein